MRHGRRISTRSALARDPQPRACAPAAAARRAAVPSRDRAVRDAHRTCRSQRRRARSRQPRWCGDRNRRTVQADSATSATRSRPSMVTGRQGVERVERDRGQDLGIRLDIPARLGARRSVAGRSTELWIPAGSMRRMSGRGPGGRSPASSATQAAAGRRPPGGRRASQRPRLALAAHTRDVYFQCELGGSDGRGHSGKAAHQRHAECGQSRRRPGARPQRVGNQRRGARCSGQDSARRSLEKAERGGDRGASLLDRGERRTVG